MTDNKINVGKIVAYKQTILKVPLSNWETTMQRFSISHAFYDQS